MTVHGLAASLRRVALALALFPSVAGAFQMTGHEFMPNREPPAYCASFDRPLAREGFDPDGVVAVEPPADIAVTASGSELCVQGLRPNERYAITVRDGLRAADGSVLAESRTVWVRIPSLPPQVRFAGPGFVLPRAGTAGPGFETMNVERLSVRVLRANDRLAARLQPSEMVAAFGLDMIGERDATEVWSGEMAVAAAPNQWVRTAFPLAEAVTGRDPGLYLVIARDAALAAAEAGKSWRSEVANRIAARWLVRTDIVPTVYGGADGLTVVARSLSTAEPVRGARAVLVARDNAILGEARTDASGLVAFAPGLLRGKGGGAAKTVMLYGEAGDFTLLDLEQPAFDFSDRGADGAPHRGPLDAMVWTERGIYRPGETVHVSLLLRDRDARAAEGVPLTLVVTRPDGVEHHRAAVTPTAGGAAVPVALSQGARRGGWSVAVHVTGAADPIGQAQFEVEDFVPPRLKVAFDPVGPATAPEPGTTVTLGVMARFLYGAPGAGLVAVGGVETTRDDTPFPGFEDYGFGPARPFTTLTDAIAPVESDAEGRIRLPVPVPPVAGEPTPLTLSVTAEVREPGGRVVTDRVSVPLRAVPVYLGVRPLFGRVAPQSGEAAFEVVSLDARGRPAARSGLRWSIERIDNDTLWYAQAGAWSWRTVERSFPVASGDFATDAGTPARVAAGALKWGTHRLRVEDPAAGAVTEHVFHVGWIPQARSGEGRPDKVEVALDRATVQPGGTVRVTATPPFPGQLQLVVASDRVHETRTLAVGTDPVSLDIRADKDWGPGAYALLTFLRPVDTAAGHRPVRAVGVAWIGLDRPDRRLAVAVEAPDRVRPRQPVEVAVTVAGGTGEAFVSLAAVDEGILNLTRYDAPDPQAHFLGKRRLGVQVRDQYGRLLDGNAGPAGPIRQGGDGDLGGAGLPVSSSRVVSLFSGVVPVRGGRAVIPLDIPDFAGSLRLMAVAWTADGLGSAQATMTVRDPVVAEVALPRFLAPGDTADATLTVHNVEGGAGDYTVTVTPTGPLSLTGGPPGPLTLAAGERRTLALPLRADAAGIAAVGLTLEGPGGLSIARSWDLAIRAAQAPIVLADVRQQAPGERVDLNDALLAPFQPGTGSLRVSYSALPEIDVPGLLKHLNRYPYGCLEQSVSVALPLLAFPGLARELELDLPGDRGLGIAMAIARVLDRQGGDGGFGQWSPGDGFADPWLQMYAVDFLVRARAAGHAVPDGALAAALDWASTFVRTRVDGEGPDMAAVAYGFWLLARDGRAPLGDLRYFDDRLAREADRAGAVQPERLSRIPWARPAALSPLPHAFVGAALSRVGDTPRAAGAFARARAALGGTGGDFYASAERDAAATLVLAATAKDQATIDAAGAMVARQARQRVIWNDSTQRKAWLLLAAEALLATGEAPRVTRDGVALAAIAPGTASLSPRPEELARGVTLVNAGGGPVWRTVTLRGTPKESPPPVAAGGLTLSRTHHAMDGTPLDPAALPRHTRMVVVLEGKLTGDTLERALVLVDPLPAGWEIESVVRRAPPATDPLGWIGAISEAALREARDDRFVAALERQLAAADGDWYDEEAVKPLRSGEFRFAYVARAVTPGVFALPPATVEDMYDSGTIARTAGGVAVVSPGP